MWRSAFGMAVSQPLGIILDHEIVIKKSFEFLGLYLLHR